MKKLSLLALSLAALLVGCGDGLTARERTCIEFGGDVNECMQGYRPVARHMTPGVNTNYYGSPQHGYWQGGSYHFNDPHSAAARSTEAFLVGAGMGSLAAYAATKAAQKSNWEKSNPKGWEPEYRDKKGNVISKQEFDRRKQQSQKDKQKAQKAKHEQAKAKEAQRRKEQSERDKAKHRQEQSARDKAKHQASKTPDFRKTPASNKPNFNKAPQKPNFNKAQQKPRYKQPEPRYKQQKPRYKAPASKPRPSKRR